MIYQIKITDDAIKALRKITEPYRSLLKSKIDALTDFSPATAKVKALRGDYRGIYRLRVGDYRVLFTTEENTLTVIDAFPRGDDY